VGELFGLVLRIRWLVDGIVIVERIHGHSGGVKEGQSL
jgi:hypothetical protein